MSRFSREDGRPDLTAGTDDTGGGEISLHSLPGVGRAKAEALIDAGYRSLREVADTPIDELRRVPGLGPRSAEQVKAGAMWALSRLEAERDQTNVVPMPSTDGRRRARDFDQEWAASSGDGDAIDALDTDALDASARDTDWLDTDALDTKSLDTDAPLAGQLDTGEGDEEPWRTQQAEDNGGAWRDPDDGAESDLEGVAEAYDVAPMDLESDRSKLDYNPYDDPGADDEKRVREQEPDVDDATAGTQSLDAAALEDEALDVHLSVHIDSTLLADFDAAVARRFEVVPMQKVGNSVLVASENPLDEEQLHALSREVGMPVRAIASQVASLDATLRSLYEGNSLRSRSRGIGEILIELGLITPQQLAQALAHQMRENNPFFRPSLSIDQSLLRLVNEGLARRFNMLPLYKTEKGLLVATSEHLDTSALREIQRATGLEPAFVIVGPSELQRAMTACYQVRQRYELRQMWLGEILISRGLITRHELDACLAAQAQSRKKLGQLLVEHDYINEDTLFPILAEKLGMEYRRFEHTDVDHQLTYLVSERFAERNLVLPLKLNYEEELLEVAVSDPTNLQVRDMLDSVAEAQGAELKLVLAGPSRLRESISYAYSFNKQMEMDLEEMEIEADWEEGDARSEITITEDLPKMRRIVNKLLYEAVREGASDIHIENLETRTQVRFRIDGILHEKTTPVNKGNIRKIISVLKIDSGLNIAERRRAQDGVFKMRIGKDRNIDFRINVHATQFGEDAVIRVLDRTRNLLDLGELGFAPNVQSRYESLVMNPQGLILITGPTGSGKTTTLYSTLAHLNVGDKKIVTAEDPVEYHLDGITQYQVNNFIGNTFAEYTRRFLRKDPDIILVGEIRDQETAVSCMRAAMTGHLVFSTLHTNDAISVVQRLRDLGLDSSSLADALLCIMQQRLARRNCADCRKPYTPDPSVLREFYPDGSVPPEARFVHGTGCSTCHGKGLRGRVGLYEFWAVKRATRQVIGSGADETDIRNSALENGLESLVEDALRKVYSGLTTLEELRRVVPVEQIRSHSGYYRYQ